MAYGIVGVSGVSDDILNNKAEKGHKHSTDDIIEGIFPIARGGTGNSKGLAELAKKLETAITIQANLSSTSETLFDGSENITIGVSGTLPIANGGTGATTAANAIKNLGAFSSNGGTISGNIRIQGKVAIGNENVKAEGSYAFAHGNTVTATGISSHAEGIRTTANGSASHAEGSASTANGNYSHAEGSSTKTEGSNSHAEGYNTTATGDFSHSEGAYTEAIGESSHAEGCFSKSKGQYSSAGGLSTIASAEGQTTVGCYNKESTDTNDVFIVGNGIGNTRSNCLRVTKTNGVFSNSTYKSSGADYAELFQWLDKNINKEDRTGLFVTLDGEEIRIATPEDDYILGIVSACPSVCGDVCDDTWKDIYQTTVFGRLILEEIDIPDETIEMPDPQNPEKTITQIIRMAHKEIVPKLNPKYDSTQEYIPRSERPEWDAVGMLGKLVTVDDGSCEVNRWCKVGKGGVATKSEKRTQFRVMSRLDKNHIRVLIL